MGNADKVECHLQRQENLSGTNNKDFDHSPHDCRAKVSKYLNTFLRPLIKILVQIIISVDVSDEASRTLVWSEGAFSATMSKLVEFPNNAEMMQILIGGGEEDAFEARSGTDFGDSITENPRIFPGASHPIVRCEFTLPGTPYRELRWKKVPPLPFLNNSESTNVRLGPVILVIFVSMIFQCQIK